MIWFDDREDQLSVGGQLHRKGGGVFEGGQKRGGGSIGSMIRSRSINSRSTAAAALAQQSVEGLRVEEVGGEGASFRCWLQSNVNRGGEEVLLVVFGISIISTTTSSKAVHTFDGKVGAEANHRLALAGAAVPGGKEGPTHGEEPVEADPDGGQVPPVEEK